jgi:hypothetical protein
MCKDVSNYSDEFTGYSSEVSVKTALRELSDNPCLSCIGGNCERCEFYNGEGD